MDSTPLEDKAFTALKAEKFLKASQVAKANAIRNRNTKRVPQKCRRVKARQKMPTVLVGP